MCVRVRVSSWARDECEERGTKGKGRIQPPSALRSVSFALLLITIFGKNCMPSVLRVRGYRFFFYSKEETEMMHIHVEKGDNVAKSWLNPVELEDSYGFNAPEINELRKIIIEHQQTLITAWNEYFS